MKTIFPNELAKMLQQGTALRVVDVREPEELEEGMIAGAIHVPLGELPARYKELDESVEHVMVCRSGRRSERACQFLQQQGFRVINMEGGMLLWESQVK